jgi:transposase
MVVAEPLLQAVQVTPYRMSGKRGKNDAADAAAICEAVSRPNMRFVPVKSEEQQARLMVHRARQGFVTARAACINRIRGLLSEFGHVMPLKAEVVRRQAREHLEDLPGYANLVIGDLLSEVSHLDERIKHYDKHIRAMAKDCTDAQQLMQLAGVGETTATAIVAMVGNAGRVRQRPTVRREGSAWCRGSTARVARRAWGASPRPAMPTCAACWCWAPARC